MSLIWKGDFAGLPGKVVLASPMVCANTAKGDNKLYSDARGVVPSLDLRFASQKNLNDYMTGTPLVDHQRSMSGSNLSPGTFVNSSGLIETAKVNLLPYSQDLSGASWQISDVNRSYDTAIAPDNTQTADSATSTTSSSFSRVWIAATPASGTTLTCSCYLRADVPFTGSLTIRKNGSQVALKNINIGTEWQRFDITDSSAFSTGFDFHIFLNPDGISGTSVTGRVLYVWGVQAETSATPTTYIPTTNLPSAAPRFDHNPTTGESLGLLIEESRTNLIVYSENFDTTTTSWFNVTGGTGQTPAITPNAAVSPDGTSNATQIDFDVTGGSTGGDVSTISQTYSANATNYTLSAWIKADSNFNLVFDHNTGTVNTVSVTTEWQRITYTKLNASGSRQVRIGLRGDLPVPQTATIYIWGVQIEEGSFPTSYIPTSGTALTRSADVASITGSNFTSRYNQSEGTIFGDYGWTVSAKNRVSTAAGTGTNGNNGFLRAVGTTVTIPRIKQAIGLTNFSAGNIATPDNQISYLNGSLGGNLANIVFPDYPPDLQIGRQTGSSIGYLNGYVARLTYFPERLPDATLQAITA